MSCLSTTPGSTLGVEIEEFDPESFVDGHQAAYLIHALSNAVAYQREITMKACDSNLELGKQVRALAEQVQTLKSKQVEVEQDIIRLNNTKTDKKGTR